MLDTKYYTRVAFQDKPNLVDKFFSNFKFHSLYEYKKFLSNLPNRSDLLEGINNDSIKNKLLDESNSLSLHLESLEEKPIDFLNDKVFPQMDMNNLLYDLNPKRSGKDTLVDCPCCQDNKTKGYIAGSTIICNRQNNCGEKTSVFTHVRNRENLDYMGTIRYLSEAVGVDYDVYTRNREMHIEDNGVFQDKNYLNEATEIKKRNLNPRQKDDIYGVGDFDTHSADLSKEFKKVNLLRVLHNYNKYTDKDKLRIIYSYIKDFTLKEPDRKGMEHYLANRGISKESAKDYGHLKSNKINALVNELKEIFGKEDLVRFGVLSEKGNWRYALLTKDNEYKYSDSIVLFANDIYSNAPTNIEFKFYTEEANGSPRKAVSMANSELLESNYFSNCNIENIKNAHSNGKTKAIWWCEGALDVKCLESMGENANGLIGAGKHFNYNLGQYKDMPSIISLDEDAAGIKNTTILIKKLKKIGVKNIYIANWEEKYGSDLNDLVNGQNLDKIKIVKPRYSLNKETNDLEISYDIQNSPASLNEVLINRAYGELKTAYNEIGKEYKNLAPNTNELKKNTSTPQTSSQDEQKQIVNIGM